MCKCGAFSPLFVDSWRKLKFRIIFRALHLLKRKGAPPKINFSISPPAHIHTLTLHTSKQNHTQCLYRRQPSCPGLRQGRGHCYLPRHDSLRLPRHYNGHEEVALFQCWAKVVDVLHLQALSFSFSFSLSLSQICS